MTKNVPLFKMYADETDVEAVAQIIRRGSFWSSGPEIDLLERDLASYVGARYSVTFNSGTSALHTALLAHNITAGEVIVPSFTFIATANAVALAGARPIFAEVEDQSYGLDSEDVEKKINKKTRAIIPVHYGGFPCKEIKKLREIADEYNLILIEDAAESLGAKINDQMVGTFGQSSIFSFCQNKIITAGEGGAIVTDSQDIYQRLKLFRSHGRLENAEGYFSTTKELDYIQVGYNYRMSTISAALVLSQLKRIQKIIQMRREKAMLLTKRLSQIKNIKTPIDTKQLYSVYQMYTIQLPDEQSREKLQNHLTECGVMTKVYFEPVHLKTFYRTQFKYKPGDLPFTEALSKKVLTLPIYPTLSESEIDYMSKVIMDCFR